MKNSMTVSLVQPNFQQGGGQFPGYWLPHSSACVLTYAQWAVPEVAFTVNRIVFRRENIARLVADLAGDDVVLFSCYMWNWQYNLELSRQLASVSPNTVQVFGGPQVSEWRLEQQREAYPWVHTWIVSEGELSFESFVRDWMVDAVKPTYSAQRLSELDIPSPYLTGFFDQLLRENPDIQWSTTLETNRGCPFKCTFCDWGSLTYAQVKRFPEPKVYAEIDWIGRNRVAYVFVADANFGMFPDRDHQIARRMVECQQRHGYPDTWNANWHKNSRQNVLPIVETLTAGGKNRAMTISVQSMSEPVQTAIERRNMQNTQLHTMFDLINERGLSTYTELILPLPEETAHSWRTGLAEVLSIGQHNSIEIWFHQLLENAASTSDHVSKYGFETRELPGYISGIEEPDSDHILENTEVVVATNTMTYEEFIDCWQYSSMIINFHCGGWSQLIARVLVGCGESDYHSLYEQLWHTLQNDEGIIGQQWRDQRLCLEQFLNGRAPQGFSAHTFLWHFNGVLHSNSEAAWGVIRKAFSPSESLLHANQLYVHNINCNYPIQHTAKHNYFEFLSGRKGPVLEGEWHYQINCSYIPSSLSEHVELLYYRRRGGYGKTDILLL